MLRRWMRSRMRLKKRVSKLRRRRRMHPRLLTVRVSLATLVELLTRVVNLLQKEAIKNLLMQVVPLKKVEKRNPLMLLKRVVVTRNPLMTPKVKRVETRNQRQMVQLRKKVKTKLRTPLSQMQQRMQLRKEAMLPNQQMHQKMPSQLMLQNQRTLPKMLPNLQQSEP